MNNKLKIRMEVWGTTLVVKILEMDERFRADAASRRFVSKNGITICSSNSPAIDDSYIYLRGICKHEDAKVFSYTFKTEDKAKISMVKHLNALHEWANNWEGFKEKKETEAVNSDNIYTF